MRGSRFLSKGTNKISIPSYLTNYKFQPKCKLNIHYTNICYIRPIYTYLLTNLVDTESRILTTERMNNDNFISRRLILTLKFDEDKVFSVFITLLA